MAQGTIKHWNRDRGFGFVTPDDGGADVFCHCRQIARTDKDHLEIGTRVTFDTAPDQGSGKLEARNVKVL